MTACGAWPVPRFDAAAAASGRMVRPGNEAGPPRAVTRDGPYLNGHH